MPVSLTKLSDHNKSKSDPETDVQIKTETKPPSGKAWMLRGPAAKAAIAQEETRQSSGNAARRFRIKDGETKKITFVDGDLDEEGGLDPLGIWEHTVQIGKRYFDVPCLDQNIPSHPGPCPLCQSDVRRSLVFFFTVIDHEGYTDGKGTAHANIPRLFVPKLRSLKALQGYAVKRNGLTGWQVEVMRTGEKSANVGSDFDFEEHIKPNHMVKQYGDSAAPIDYMAEIEKSLMTREQLLELGYGHKGVGHEDVGPNAVDDDDMEDEL